MRKVYLAILFLFSSFASTSQAVAVVGVSTSSQHDTWEDDPIDPCGQPSATRADPPI